MKTVARIPFTEIESIPQLIKDFLNADLPGSEQFLFSDANIAAAADKKKESFTPESRRIIADVMRSQHSQPSEKQRYNFDLLNQENTLTVCTGHQLNFFTGPVFFIYKILQTIKTAEYLNSSISGSDFVPVFWMATEDHDFEEISHFQAFGNRFNLPSIGNGAVGRLKIEETPDFESFSNELKHFPFGEELVDLARKAYRPGNSLADATKTIVQELFSDFGLLVIDGDDVALKEQMKPLFRDELLKNDLSEKTSEKVEYLSGKYGKVQVNPRDINLFLLDHGRNRIERSGEEFRIVDTEQTFTEEELLERLKNSPEKFSPNALMRPVFQETVLPNVAYIGGNAEIMYWLELQDYFQSVQLPFPVLVPRCSFLFMTEKQHDKSNNLGITPEMLFRNSDAIKNDKITSDNALFGKLTSLEQNLNQQFHSLEEIAGKTDITFGNLVKAEQVRQMRSLERMRNRLLRAEKRKNREILDRIDRLYAGIHPGGTWQERKVNFSEFYAVHGPEWLKTCLEQINPATSEMVVMVD